MSMPFNTQHEAEHRAHPHLNGDQWRFTFTNGYGASVVRSSYSYGGSEGFFELAVLRRGRLCYDTPITSDVIGWLDAAAVVDLLDKIAALQAVAS